METLVDGPDTERKEERTVDMMPLSENDILWMSNLYWIERKGEQELKPILLRDGDIRFNEETWFIQPDCYPFTDLKPMTCSRFYGDTYGTRWRLWHLKPTAEQREAVPWES